MCSQRKFEVCPKCGASDFTTKISLGQIQRICSYCGNSYPTEIKPSANRYKEPDIETSQVGVEIFAHARLSVVEIEARFKSKRGTEYSCGSGFILSESGYILTNAHVLIISNKKFAGIKPDIYAKLKDDESYPLQFIEANAQKDLAVLKFQRMPQKYEVARFLSPEGKIYAGETAFVVGNPMCTGTCMTDGIVSDGNKTFNGIEVFQISNAVNLGNSGGPVFNRNGEVIGIVKGKMGVNVENISFCIPSEIAVKFLQDVGKSKGIDFKL